MDLSVITATSQRPEYLAHCLYQFQQQSMNGLRCEQMVVSDGLDPHARAMCERFGVRYLELPEPHYDFGSCARDVGIQQAQGKFVCFWDDDNLYYPHALATLYATVQGADIGVVRTEHRLRKRTGLITLPRQWTGSFINGDIDTMCVCVRTKLAQQEAWVDDCTEINTDYRWLNRLLKHQPTLRYVPIVIGMHV